MNSKNEKHNGRNRTSWPVSLLEEHKGEIIKQENYLTQKSSEIEVYNKKENADKDMLLNGRNLTNLGVFRTYIEEYLKAHPMTNDDLTMMCRQLEPTSQGIPIQIYAFSKDKEWTKYEAITSDIFDHLLSSVKYFKLECFELNQYTSN